MKGGRDPNLLESAVDSSRAAAPPLAAPRLSVWIRGSSEQIVDLTAPLSVKEVGNKSDHVNPNAYEDKTAQEISNGLVDPAGC
ncbi:hypothetical protein GUJ93_ZPchr0013g34990 [Zizania palustris]|uniref:Uncharacterized protein n=1 Tax=Zizania palustris TaxID=103762 RepID=A0A8J6C0W9_ZIZPA|nr:hypothetical protein GUJ93_ZPchr0013g34990 [Zizania palustris]